MGAIQQPIINSLPIQGSKQQGFSHIYRNPQFMDKLQETPSEKYHNLRDIFVENCLHTYPNQRYLGQIILKKGEENGGQTVTRQLKTYKYKEVFHLAENVGSYILNNKLEFLESLHDMKMIGIFSKNRYEWLVVDHACLLYGLTVIPLYDTFGLQNLSYCLNHSEIRTCFCSAETIQTFLKLKDHGQIKTIVSFDPLTKQKEQSLKKLNVSVLYFKELLKRTQQNIMDYKKIKVHKQLCHTFSYTSGTTGPPKGAMISHKNFLCFICASMSSWAQSVNQNDSHLSFLPLPHMLQRGMVVFLAYKGCFITFYSGDIANFKDDLAFVKPTLFVAVPRLYNKIVDGVKAQFNEVTGLKRYLLDQGVSTKLHNVRTTGECKHFFYDTLIFNKVKQKFGGQVKIMGTGSAPIKTEVFEWMKILMGCPIFQGYGQTQNTVVATFQKPGDLTCGHVGGIVKTLEMKLMDIPEMNYTSEDKDEDGNSTPRGQIWLRGSSVFIGYYKDKEKTKQAITEDGWLRTGDVGMILPKSYALKIIDRKKNIFKLQQGQYVASERVQIIYTSSGFISEAFLYGDPMQTYAIAVVGFEKQNLIKFAQQNGIKIPYEQLCKDKKLRTLVCKKLNSIGKQQGGLKGFEQAKNIYIQPQNFGARNILTNTMKLQRFAARKFYEKELAEMYKQGELDKKE